MSVAKGKTSQLPDGGPRRIFGGKCPTDAECDYFLNVQSFCRLFITQSTSCRQLHMPTQNFTRGDSVVRSSGKKIEAILEKDCGIIQSCNFTPSGANYQDQCVSLRALPHISKTTCPNVTKFGVNVICAGGSILLWRQCNPPCTFALWMTFFSHDVAAWQIQANRACAHQRAARIRYGWTRSLITSSALLKFMLL